MAKEDLYNDLKKLINQANRRILNIEKTTGIKDGFATKELFDYLTLPNSNYKTKKGRISFSKEYNLDDIRILQKGINNFLSKDTSTVKGIKSKIKEYKGWFSDRDISYREANAIYRLKTDYKKTFEGHSEFWDLARETVEFNYDKEDFINKFMTMFTEDAIRDEMLKQDLTPLYEYAKGVKLKR